MGPHVYLFLVAQLMMIASANDTVAAVMKSATRPIRDFAGAIMATCCHNPLARVLLWDTTCMVCDICR